MLYQVVETFYSIQGEGYWSGAASWFIRLAGCNLDCAFCDTDKDARRAASAEEMLEEAGRCPARRLVLTGGEPTLQPVQALIDVFRVAGWFVQVETNGTQALPEADWITFSPKAGVEYPADLRANEVKVVLDGQVRPGDFLDGRFEHFFIQPCSQDFAPAVKYVRGHPEWRLSLQAHKTAGFR